MNKEDMIRMIESGEELPDYCQEEFDKLLFKENRDGKISIRRIRRVFTDVGKSPKLGISRFHADSRAVRSNSRLQQTRQQIHSSRIRKK